MNLLTKKKMSHRCRKQTVVTKDGGWGDINWEIRINIYTLNIYRIDDQ